MAHLDYIPCLTCLKDTQHVNGVCSECYEKKKAERIRMWNSQDLDTKLNDLRERLERLERQPLRF